MSKVEKLIEKYQKFVSIPWDYSLAGPQKIWFVIYDKMDERRIRARCSEFELATRNANHGWELCDLTDSFAEWMANEDYRDSYFENPDDIDLVVPEFKNYVVQKIKAIFSKNSVKRDTVVAIQGIACLFGFIRVSEVIQAIASDIKGRLLVFFPGEHEGNNYRLLDARDGWNYLAVPITFHGGGGFND